MWNKMLYAVFSLVIVVMFFTGSYSKELSTMPPFKTVRDSQKIPAFDTYSGAVALTVGGLKANISPIAIGNTTVTGGSAGQLLGTDGSKVTSIPIGNTSATIARGDIAKGLKHDDVIYKMASGSAVNIVAFGDSITFGRKVGTYGDGDCATLPTPAGEKRESCGSVQVANPYPLALETLLRDYYNNSSINVYNQGWPGRTSSDMVGADYLQSVSNQSPDLILLMTGINDDMQSVTPEQYFDNLRTINAAFNVPVVVIGSTPFWGAYYSGVPNEAKNLRYAAFIDAARQASAQSGNMFIHASELISRYFTDGTYTPDQMFPDMVHFDDSYYALLADLIFPSLVASGIQTDGETSWEAPSPFFRVPGVSPQPISKVGSSPDRHAINLSSSGTATALSYIWVNSPSVRAFVYVDKTSTSGTANTVTVDGVVKTVDCYAASTSHYQPIDIGTLSYGLHKLEYTAVAGDFNLMALHTYDVEASTSYTGSKTFLANVSAPGFYLDNYATSTTPGWGFVFRTAENTYNAPRRVQDNRRLMRIGIRPAYAADDTSVASFPAGSKAYLDFYSVGAQTSTNSGTRASISLTPSGSAAPSELFKFGGDGVLQLSGISDGTNSATPLQIATAVTQAGTALQPAAIGTTVQAYNSNTTVQGVITPSSIGAATSAQAFPPANTTYTIYADQVTHTLGDSSKYGQLDIKNNGLTSRFALTVKKASDSTAKFYVRGNGEVYADGGYLDATGTLPSASSLSTAVSQAGTALQSSAIGVTVQGYNANTTTQGTITTSSLGAAPLNAAAATGAWTFDTSTLAIDSTNHRVGMQTTSPSNPLHVENPSGVAVTAGRFVRSDTSTTAASTAVMLSHKTTGTATTSFGSSIGFYETDTSNTDKLMGYLMFRQSDTIVGNGDFVVQTASAGTAAEKLRLTNTGRLRLSGQESAPANNATCTAGDMILDATNGYLYLCISANSWKRFAAASY